jgi:hypothetical protein
LPDPYRNPCNVERDRQLLGLLSRMAYAAILKTFQALFDCADVRPGCVVGYVLMKKTTHYWMGITKPTFPVWQARWVRDI